MSDCFLCCSFKTWLRLVLFSLFLVKSWRRLYSGWSIILLTFSPCVRSLVFIRESRCSTPALFCIIAMSELYVAPRMVLRPMFCTWSSLSKDNIWRDKINKTKFALHVRKSRNLIIEGKLLLLKTFVCSIITFELHSCKILH